MEGISDTDREFMRSKYRVEVLLSDCDPKQIDESKYPYDSYLITYQLNGFTYNDLARGPKQVTLFDSYYDILKPSEGRVLQIKGWYGKINPKLWGQKPKKKK
jgi:hypothetical protein